MAEKRLKACDKGHKFYKSSDCPTCPICARQEKPKDGFLSRLGSPARNALKAQGISTLAELAQYSEREILALHGVGPKAMPVLREALREVGLEFEGEGERARV